MTDSSIPWFQRCRRWGQTNLTEDDPLSYDHDFWRAHWRRTRTQGVIVNAGGIVAYYPSRFPHHYRACHLGERDLFGEIVEAAREEGLVVLARMDSNRAIPAFYEEHPDWFGVNRAGEPLRSNERYMACVNGPYYKEFIPELLREIIERYYPEGFTDNSWTGVGRNYICHCPHCEAKFRRDCQSALPAEPDWDDPVFRIWIRWNYRCRLENWDLNNRVTQAAGGEHCLWLGMVHGEPISGHVHFADLPEIGKRSPILMTDQQSRTDGGFEMNGHAGKLLHEVSSWQVNLPESMALYLRGPLGFRLAANPPLEARHWMLEGIAGGISPWWHIVGAGRDERRKHRTIDDLMAWHEVNEALLQDREPLASVGIVWSNENSDFHGRDEPKLKVLAPYRGWIHACIRARIPWLPVHADAIRAQKGRLQTLILPDLRAMSEDQILAVHDFVEAGGSLLCSGQPGVMDETGAMRERPALESLLGVRFLDERLGLDADTPEDWEKHKSNNYLRLDFEDGRSHHPVIEPLGDTDIIACGGLVQRVERASAQAEVLATYVPGFRGYPPEFAWMPTPRTDEPVIVLNGRVGYLAADLDRCYELRRLPDHGDLLAGLIRWSLAGQEWLQVEGEGYVDGHLYRQEQRLILHLVNLTGCNLWPAYLETLPRIGPLTVRVRVPQGRRVARAVCRVSHEELEGQSREGWWETELPLLHAHAMLVLELA